MKVTNLLLSMLFLLNLIPAKSQTTGKEYKIPFVNAIKRPGNGLITHPKLTKEYSFLSNIPNVKCDTFAISYFKMNIKDDSIENQIYLFVGTNRKERCKYIIMDANNNKDFSDDVLLTFRLPDTPLSREQKLERCISLQVPLNSSKKDVMHIAVDPFNYLGQRINPELATCIIIGDYMTASTIIEDIPIEIDGELDMSFFKKELNENAYFIIRYKDKVNNLRSKSFKKEDTIQIQDKLFQLTQIEHPNIVLKSIGILADSSSIGSSIPILYAKELKDKTEVQLNKLMKGKYVFIDFWGSWCNPCIASIPKLKTLYEKVKDRKDVIILGLASEKENDLDKLNTIIKNEKIEWKNYWLNQAENSPVKSVIQKLDIAKYPTYLIIDNTGKIAYKNHSSYKTEEAILFFLNMIDKKQK